MGIEVSRGVKYHGNVDIMGFIAKSYYMDMDCMKFIQIYVGTFLGLFHGEQLRGMQNYIDPLQNTGGTILEFDKNPRK